MDIEKKIISNLTLCYCVAPLRYKDKPHFLVASEKEYSCLLFDEHGNEVDEIWKGPGGTMSAVQVPGTDGAFLATHRFYSPNNSKEASIVLCRPADGGWKVTTVADLPYVHRFDILQRGGVTYLIACCIKSNYEYKDDWRFPGMTYACELPDDLLSKPEDYRLPLVLLKDNMLKNHGYSRDIHNGVQTGIVTCDTGVFRFTPPAERGEARRKIDAAAAEGHAFELPLAAVRDGDRVLEVDRHDAAHAAGELLRGGVLAPGAEVAEVGVDLVPGRADHGLVAHVLGDGVHKRRVHYLHRQHDLAALGPARGPEHPLAEGPHRLRRGGLVVHVVAGELDDADAELAGEVNGPVHDVPRPGPDRRVRAAEGEASVRAQAHGLYLHARVRAGGPELGEGGSGVVEPRNPLVLFVYAYLDVVKAQLPGAEQPLLPGDGRVEGLFVYARKVVSKHRVSRLRTALSA